ncbi:MAG: RluA family pseudouridine synthase [Lachnospiraceae bacterium]|jgi:23S rRNA pseudouridine1911/1915/1917 synthase
MEKVIRLRVSAEEDGCSVLEVLSAGMGMSGRQIRRAKYRPQGICLNGVRVRTDAVVRAGDTLSVLVETEKEGSVQLVPSETDPVVVYEDDDLVIVNKPAGLAAHPSRGHFSETLANQIYGYYLRRGQEIRVRTAGRLDMDTSGLLAFAKNAPASAMYERLHREGKIRRTYLALIEGVPEKPEGTVDFPIARVRRTLPDGREMDLSVAVTGAAGRDLRAAAGASLQEARTQYRVLKTYSRGQSVYSLAEFSLATGRMHQIRVHMAAIGHPLLGDSLYGPEAALTAEERAVYPRMIGRTALHSARLCGISPLTKVPFDLKAELPEDMRRLTED